MSNSFFAATPSTMRLAMRALLFALWCHSLVVSAALAQQDPPVAPPRATGLVPDTEEDLQSAPRVPVYRAFLPSRADLSKYFPPPGDQGSIGSCVGWAVGYAARAYYAAAVEGRNLKDRSNIPSPQFIYDSIKQLGPCATAGAQISGALRLLKQGSLSLREYPSSSSVCAPPTPAQAARATDFRIDDWEIITPSSAQFLDQVKGLIYESRPVIIGMRLTPSFDRLKAGEIYRGRCKSDASCDSHAMVIVGYDEARQAFKLINSWGRDWGERGFGWLSYDSALTEIHSAYSMRVAKPNPPPLPPPSCELSLVSSAIDRGQSTQLQWRSTGAAKGAIDQGIGQVSGNGNRIVSPSRSLTYTGTFFGQSGEPAVCTVALQVREPPEPQPAVAFFRSSPARIVPGQSSELSWSVTPGASVAIDPEIGTVYGNSIRVSPAKTTTYTLSVRNGSGASTAKIDVQVVPPLSPACTLSVSVPRIARGETAVLRYESVNATGGSIDNAVGKVPPNGSTTITPDRTTIYNGTFGGVGGTSYCTTTITVDAPAPKLAPPTISWFSAQPPEVSVGESATLSWSVTGASAIEIDNGIGVVGDGEVSISPRATTRYVLTARNAAGQVTAGATVAVRPPDGPVRLLEGACGKIEVSDRQGQRVITGFVGKDGDLAWLRAESGGSELQVSVHPWPQCEALLTLDAALARADKPQVHIRRPDGDHFIRGDALVFEVETPAYPSYLHVAYVQADGSVLNLVQPDAVSFTAYAPRTRLVLGTGPRRFRVASPYGREMLVVLSARSPVFPEARPVQETEREFLTALRRALLAKPAPSAPDREIAANFDAIVTEQGGAQ